jgi:hypothetical protein
MVLAMLFAGCAAAQSKDVAPTGKASSTVDASSASTGPVGSLKGLIRSEELTPIAGASVALLQTSFEVKTDESGAFAFVNLPINSYTLVANRLGYDSKAQKVTARRRG